MSAPITTALVWREIERQLFAVLSYVTPRARARSAGVVYVVQDRKLYIRVADDSWKAKHVRRNPHVALNVPIPRWVPLMPWIRIPQATIAFAGSASVLDAEAVDRAVLAALGQATAHDPQAGVKLCFIEVTPVGHFATYGVGVSLLTMRDPERARGRVPVRG